jgi:hypothetical protein
MCATSTWRELCSLFYGFQFIFKQSLEKKINLGFVLFFLLCDKSIKENQPDLKLEQGTRSEEIVSFPFVFHQILSFINMMCATNDVIFCVMFLESSVFFCPFSCGHCMSVHSHVQLLITSLALGFVLFFLLCDKSIKENQPDLKLEQGTRSEEMQQNSKYNPAKRTLKRHTFLKFEKYNIM